MVAVHAQSLYKGIFRSVKMTSATLQNNIRLRVFLILCVSIVVQLLRPMVSTSVYKATDVLRLNYVLYGIVMVTSVITFRWTAALGLVVQSAATVLDVLWFVLATLATLRCVEAEQAGCLHTLPASMVCLALMALLCLLDLLQTWSLYRILRMPTFLVSPIQRVRILFAWAVPFAWLNTILLMQDSAWTLWVSVHIVVDPMVIVMASVDEFTFLAVVIVMTVLTDVFALFWVAHPTVRSSIMVQLVLSLGGLAVLWLGRPKAVALTKASALTKATALTPTVAPKTAEIRKRKLDF